MSAACVADEPIHEDAVDRRSALEAPVRVDRRHATQLAEVGRSAAPPVDVCSAHRAQPASRTDSGTKRRSGTVVKAAIIVRRGRKALRRAPLRIVVVSRTSTTACSRSAPRSPPGVARCDRRAPHGVRLRPGLDGPAGGWDRRGGFGTEGESARARREEDRRACAVLGATPVWLPFGSVDYERHGEDGDVREPSCAAVDECGPGARSRVPAQPSRPRMARADVASAPRAGRVALYAEQPYTRREGASRSAAMARGARRARGVRAGPSAPRDRAREVARDPSYSSQLPCSGCEGASGEARTATPSVANGSPGLPGLTSTAA